MTNSDKANEAIVHRRLLLLIVSSSLLLDERGGRWDLPLCRATAFVIGGLCLRFYAFCSGVLTSVLPLSSRSSSFVLTMASLIIPIRITLRPPSDDLERLY